MNLKKALRAIGAVVLEETERNPEFAARLLKALGDSGESSPPTSSDRRSNLRAPALLDPIGIFAERGEGALRQELQSLSLDKLLDIVAEFGMDPSKLVMKWKNASRVTEHIVENARRRSAKGDAFRS